MQHPCAALLDPQLHEFADPRLALGRVQGAVRAFAEPVVAEFFRLHAGNLQPHLARTVLPPELLDRGVPADDRLVRREDLGCGSVHQRESGGIAAVERGDPAIDGGLRESLWGLGALATGRGGEGDTGDPRGELNALHDAPPSGMPAPIILARGRMGIAQRRRARVTPSPIGTSERSMRVSASRKSLNSRSADVSGAVSPGSATAPPQSVLSTAINPPGRMSRISRS